MTAPPPSPALAAPAARPDEREDGLCCGLTHAPDVRLQLGSTISSQRWQLCAARRPRSGCQPYPTLPSGELSSVPRMTPAQASFSG